MNLFLKIFLWFMAAIALMIGVVIFLNWTVQTEPVVSRWQTSVRNQTNIYAATGAQIYATEGEAGLRKFLQRVREGNSATEIDVVAADGKLWFGDVGNVDQYSELVRQAFGSGTVQLELSAPDTALTAKTFSLPDGRTYVLIIRWERPAMPVLFGESWLRYLRLGVLFLTALIVCYALAKYLSSPIGKIRQATQGLAAGDLSTRVAERLGGRRDELGKLAQDFDVMAERIEGLVTSQQRLTRDVSHELRSPLARMNVALELAKQRFNGEGTKVLDRIENESQRLNEMISRLLTLSKLESGTRDFERHEIDLTRVLNDVVEDADFEARARGKSVSVSSADPCRIRGSAALIRSAIENVLRNAVKYTKENSEVVVELRSEGGNSVITVTDAGGGVPEAELKNLFKPFYRVGESRERRTGGMGLGLAIAEQAVIAHNGTIAARNSGEGLEVRIVLPCA
jgi:two-component system sensor histidine kinase CpxA